MDADTEAFDFLVVGSGSGLDVANAAARRGQSVAVVEKGPLGGTCLNRGCIPSKKLLYHAEVLETVERADEFGIHAEVTDVDFAEIVREVNEDVSESADSIRQGLGNSGQHTLFEGEGRFVDDRTIELVDGPDAGARARAETVLIAAGTRPAVPPIEGIEDVDSLTSTEALQLETPPDHLVIVGGGYVAAELAHFFGTFGSDVSIVGRRPHLLPDADEAVAAAFTDRYAERFDLYTGYEAVAAGERGDEVTVEARPFPPAWEGDEEFSTGDAAQSGRDDGPSTAAPSGRDDGPSTAASSGHDDVTVTGDALLVAAGRRPNTDRLDVGAAGVETDAQGFVETDDYLRTTADGVWALGDIVGEYLLKHNANHEARTVARNLFGDELEPVDYTAMPFAVFASPEVAGVGTLEQDLREAGREYATRTYRYEDTARGSAMKVEGLVKTIIDTDGTILGCHILGPEASNLIEEVVVAMKSGTGTVRDIREAVHIHPALSEVVDRAFAGQFTLPEHLADRDNGHHHHGHDHDGDHGHGYDHDGDHGHGHDHDGDHGHGHDHDGDHGSEHGHE